jgi:arylsulfatase A-like enzyme
MAAEQAFSQDAGQAADPRPNVVFAIADDWSWPHAGAYGDPVVKTPNFDRLAREGVVFTRAFCASPSCTPSRGAILTGQAVHRLEEGGNLWSRLPAKFAAYPDLLEARGYRVGLTGKGWGPGRVEGSGRSRNPAGPGVKDFRSFLESVPDGRPFCYWFGSTDPHRPYAKGSGLASGKAIADVEVPPFLPDTPEVRGDLLDYYAEVERFDAQVGEILAALDESGLSGNTLVVVTSDNGMPFPRAKANLYDSGTHMPLVVRWPAKVPGGRTSDAFVGAADFAPTILEAAGLEPPPDMTGRSFLGLLTDARATSPGRDRVFLERERHANVRAGDLSYPCRAVRTESYLYIRNLRPDRWPAGDPEMYFAVGPFGDIDPSPSKALILDRRDDPAIAPFFRLACARRPEEELYDLSRDPGQLKNVAGRPEHAEAQRALRESLDRWMSETADPRARDDDDRWDRYPYFGARGR